MIEYFCQLKDGFVLRSIAKDIYKVIHTGYPYPDTKYSTSEAFSLFLGKELDSSQISALQDRLIACNGKSLTIGTLRNMLNDQLERKSSCHYSIFFRSDSLLVYFIECPSLSKDSIVRNIALQRGIENEDFLAVITSVGYEVCLHDNEVPKEQFGLFEVFNSYFRSKNPKQFGVSFYESLFRYLEKDDKVKEVSIRGIKVDYENLDTAFNIIKGGLFASVKLCNTLNNSLFVVDDVCKKIYGDGCIDLSTNYSRPSQTYASSECIAMSHLYLNCSLDEGTKRDIEESLKCYIATVLWESYENAGRKFTKGYRVVNDGVEIVIDRCIMGAEYFRKSSSPYKDFIEFMLVNFPKTRVSEFFIEDKNEQVGLIDIRGILGSTFTGYEDRLFQFLVVYFSLFENGLSDESAISYTVVDKWELKFLSFMFENFNRRLLMNGLSFTDYMRYFNVQISVKHTKNQPESELHIPNLLWELKLDQYDGRQFSLDEIVFLMGMTTRLWRMVSFKADEVEKIHTLKLTVQYFNGRQELYDPSTRIQEDMLDALRTWFKIALLATSYNLQSDQLGVLRKYGDPRFLGEKLFTKGYINRLKDRDFEMKIFKNDITVSTVIER